MRLSPSALVFAIALIALLSSRVAAAEMRFAVPDGCGSAAEFRSELAGLVGDAAREAEPSVLEIAPAAGGFRLHLELAGETREIADADCRTLLRSAVVIAAAAARSTPPEPAPPPPLPPVAPAPEPPPPPAAAAEEPPPVIVREEPRVMEPSRDAPAAPRGQSEVARPALVALGAGIGVSVGTVPGTSAVLELRGGLDPAPLGFAAALRYWPGSSAETDGRSVHVSALGGRVAALVELGSVLHASLGLEVDRLAGTGQQGVSGRSSDSVWLIAGVLELNAIPWSIEDLRIELGLGAQLPLVRPRFEVLGYGRVYEVPEVGGGAIIRAVWLFP